jgi:flagellar basal-body rod modification protein FlgD
MNIQGTNGVLGAAATPTAPTRSAAQLQDQFLRLLVVQLQNQDPLNPTSQADFTGQLAQLSTLDSLQQLNNNFQSMFQIQQLTQGANLIGKLVKYEGPSGLEQGVVGAVNITGGVVQLMVGTQAVALDKVRSVEAAP